MCGASNELTGNCCAGGPATHSEANDPVRYLLELHAEPARIAICDVDSGEPLAELASDAAQRLIALPDDELRQRSEQVANLLDGALASSVGDMPTFPLRRGADVIGDAAVAAGGTKKTRRKLWELSHKLHCPVIGTCLDSAELRKLARRAGAWHEGPISDYEVHVSFVSAADDKNVLSLAAHKALDKKFASQVKRFARAKSANELTALWEDSLGRGDVPGGVWAGLTHPNCDEALRARIFEEVHMLSHQVGAGQRADLKKLTRTEAALSNLQRDFDALHKRSRRQLEDREQRIHDLEKQQCEDQDSLRAQCLQLTELKQLLGVVEHQLQRANSKQIQAELDRVTQELDQERRRNEEWRRLHESTHRQVSDLDKELRQTHAERRTLESLLAQSLSPCDRCESDNCEDCPDLGGRRILCVGGRHRLIDQYRALVARCNGQFEHHDGGVEDSRQRLEAMLSSADAVVCATDSVSHDAYYRLKRFCKRNDKPHVFLRSSGISTFAKALENVAIQ